MIKDKETKSKCFINLCKVTPNCGMEGTGFEFLSQRGLLLVLVCLSHRGWGLRLGLVEGEEWSGVYLQFQANEFLLNKNKMETCQLVSGIKETDG